MSFDPAALRSRFPLLAERIYCASQCLGPCPREMEEDLDAYRRTLGRRSRALDEWVARHDALHARLEALLDVPADSVCVRDSATAVQAAVLACLAPEPKRNRIVVSSGDFHSGRYLFGAQARRGFELVEVPANGPEHAEAETFLGAIDERTAVVALSLVSPRSGALLDARRVAGRAREVGALFFLDAYQAVGIVPVRPRELGAHVVVGGTHKWLGGGGTGLAFGFVEPELAERLEPVYPGWIGHAELTGFSDRFRAHAGARRFEQGTPALEPIYTARAGLELALDVGVEALRARSLALTGRMIARAVEHGLTVRTPARPEKRGGMLCVEAPSSAAAVAALEAKGIDVDERPGAGIRIGPHPGLTGGECDAVIDALAAAVRP